MPFQRSLPRLQADGDASADSLVELIVGACQLTSGLPLAIRVSFLPGASCFESAPRSVAHACPVTQDPDLP